MKKRILFLIFTLIVSLLLTSCDILENLPFLSGDESVSEGADNKKPLPDKEPENNDPVSLDSIPAFDGKTPYVVINGNLPFFTDAELTTESFEEYAPLDALGRCGVTVASIGRDLMPTEDRGSIGMVKPSGWHTVKYDIVNGKYLYNRCHLIGFQLTGENANEENLITGTRFMNVDGMLPFEDMVADYVKETGNHVMYRVTPIFKGQNLVAHGVLMEAMSVEDKGDDLQFCVYVYNNQPGIIINYATGESALDDGATVFPDGEVGDGDGTDPDQGGSGTNEDDLESVENTYVLNTNTMKFHTTDCQYANSMSEANKEIYVGSANDLITAGYDDCGSCKPK